MNLSSFVSIVLVCAVACALSASSGCASDSNGGAPPGSDSDTDTDSDSDSDSDSDGDTDTAIPVESCDFEYDEMFAATATAQASTDLPDAVWSSDLEGAIVHAEPQPISTFLVAAGPDRDDIVMPTYTDEMPLFERGGDWTEDTRCYELPDGAWLLTQDQAYELYREIAESTTGVALDDGPDVRTVIGMRGAYPGTVEWHSNAPNRFNDTLVLLWADAEESKHVREFAVHTDVGDYDFGFEASSSLRPNRRYHYLNGWHGSYNALHIDEWGYSVRDDTNNNGHWDSDRNGWLPPLGEDDYDRGGSGHNIHMGSVDPPLGSALVDVWSAGCQVIPGIASWTEFITNAWTEMDDPVSYFLIDVRDIPPEVWAPCDPDGSHACPFEIDELPFVHADDTSAVETSEFDLYNCSSLDESGPEVVYFLTLDQAGTLTAEVDCEDPVVDVDVHLLDGDDPDACLARDHWSLSQDVTPGRYFVIVDTWVDGTDPLAGPYTLTVTLD